MTNLPDMAGAAAEIELNGSSYRTHRLNIDDWAEFEQWVDDTPIRQAARNLNRIPPDLQMKIMQQAQDAASAASEEDPIKRAGRITSRMSSMSGIGFLTWLTLRQDHPDLTRKTVAGMITLDNLPYVQQRLDAINGFSSPSQKRAVPKKPRKRR